MTQPKQARFPLQTISIPIASNSQCSFSLDVPVTVPTNKMAVRDAFAGFLSQYYWDDFFTVTFKDKQRYPIGALERVQSRLPGMCRAFLAAETHLSGLYHVHGLVQFNNVDYDAEDFKSRIDRLGWCSMGSPNDIGGVAGYCSKYLTKAAVEWTMVGRGYLWRKDR